MNARQQEIVELVSYVAKDVKENKSLTNDQFLICTSMVTAVVRLFKFWNQPKLNKSQLTQLVKLENRVALMFGMFPDERALQLLAEILSIKPKRREFYNENIK